MELIWYVVSVLAFDFVFALTVFSVRESFVLSSLGEECYLLLMYRIEGIEIKAPVQVLGFLQAGIAFFLFLFKVEEFRKIKYCFRLNCFEDIS